MPFIDIKISDDDYGTSELDGEINTPVQQDVVLWFAVKERR